MPGHRSLAVNLYYNEICPDEYEPEGFIACSEDSLDPSTDNNNFLEVGTFESPACAVHARIAKVSTTQIEEVHSEKLSLKTGNTRDDAQVLVSDHLDLLQSQDEQTKRRLQQMLRSSSKCGSNLVPTQVQPLQLSTSQVPDSSQRSQRSGNLSRAVATLQSFAKRRQRNVKPEKQVGIILQAHEEQNQSRQSIFSQPALQDNRIERMELLDVMRCQCDNQDGGPCTFCHACGYWQHDDCYALSNITKDRRPREHFCYSCLLLPKEPELYSTLQLAIRARLALNFRDQNGTFDLKNPVCRSALRELGYHRNLRRD